MSIRYLLPCSSCDHQFELVATQAGQELVCPQCNSNTEAPKLGEIKKLSTVGEASGKTNKPKKGNNILATLGLAIAVLAGGAGAALFFYGSSLVRPFDLEEEIAYVNERIDELSTSEVVKFYGMIDNDEGLGEWHESNLVRYNTQGEILKKISYGLMGLGGVGLLMLVGSLFSKSKN